MTDTTRNLVERWITLEQQRNALEQGWKQQEQQLSLRLQLLTNEREHLTEALANRSETRDEVEQERLELQNQQTELESEQELLVENLERYLVRLHTLLPQLPPPLAESWRASLESPQLDMGNSSQVFELVLDLLSQFRDFEQTITLHKGLITRADGSRMMVQQLYMGVSQGWYVTEDGLDSGIGNASAEAWKWSQDERLQPATILQAIRMIESNQDIRMLSMPVRLARGVSLSSTRRP